MEQVTMTDRPDLILVLVAAYLEQREHLPGGEEVLPVEGVAYPVWIWGERPPTAAFPVSSWRRTRLGSSFATSAS